MGPARPVWEAVMRKALMLCAALAVTPALAQDEDSNPGGAGEGNVRYSKTTNIEIGRAHV